MNTGGYANTIQRKGDQTETRCSSTQETGSLGKLSGKGTAFWYHRSGRYSEWTSLTSRRVRLVAARGSRGFGETRPGRSRGTNIQHPTWNTTNVRTARRRYTTAKQRNR